MFASTLTLTFIFKLVFLAIYSKDVSAIWCFQCNSLRQPDCASIAPNDTNSLYYKECRPPIMPKSQNLSVSAPPAPNATAMFCRKIYQKIHDRDGLEVVIRTCGWIKHTKLDCYKTSSVGHKETVCQCFTEGCNSSGRNAISLAAISISTFLIAMQYH
ncbi:uncharacterized protein LOC106665003 isoform X3 [Cimex lectularius]|uniref:Protein sleepless n=1 Tax=Cimex lectularius TaxID=79782 RepID=A0A8I6TFI7_CIMLE|nr:uncharacterized protein LOC106665003 isoform X3 [Cimex lectularius]